MFYEIDPTQLLYLAAAAIPVHAAWALLARKWHPLYLLAVVMVILAPFSIARDSGQIIVALKYGRAYCAILLVFVGLLMLIARRIPLGFASKAITVFSVYYFASAFWGQEPGLAALERLRYLLLMYGGMLMGLTLLNRRELLSGYRLLLFSAVAWAALVIVGLSLGHFRNGRFAMFGMNANQVAMGCGFSFIVCVTAAIYERALLRVIGYVACGVLAVGAALTGSRAGVGALVVSSIPVIAPLMRRPLAFIVFAIGAVVVAYAASGYVVDEFAFERLLNTENTRRDVWAYSLELARQAPILGHGYVPGAKGEGQYSFGTHSIYLTVLVNSGAVGVAVFVCALLGVFWQGLAALRVVGYERKADRWPAYLAVAFLIAPLSSGIFENAPITGVSIYTLTMGIAVGLFDFLTSPRYFATGLDQRVGEASVPVPSY